LLGQKPEGTRDEANKNGSDRAGSNSTHTSQWSCRRKTATPRRQREQCPTDSAEANNGGNSLLVLLSHQDGVVAVAE
jgi:hypothetical protein